MEEADALLTLNTDLPDFDDENAEGAGDMDQSRLEQLQALRSREDGLGDFTDREWLEFPRQFLSPLVSNAVSLFAQVLPESEVKPTGAEFLFVGKGLMVPEHLQMVAWCMSQVNQFGRYTGSVVSTKDTKLLIDPLSTKKNKAVTGILRAVEPVSIQCNDPQSPEDDPRPNFIQLSMEKAASNMSNGEKVYFNAPMVTMEWGLIPIQYETRAGKAVREIVHTLRVVPAPGFDLLHFLETRIFSQVPLVCRVNQKSGKDQSDIVAQISSLMMRAMNQEMANLASFGVWNALPHPWTAMSAHSSVSPINVLSPFSLLFKIRRMAGKYKRGTLVVDGFPNMSTLEDFEACIDRMVTLNEAYRVVMQTWHEDFVKARGKDEHNESGTSILTAPLWHDGRCLDRIRCGINMRVRMTPTPLYKDTMKLKLPTLAQAAMTYFLIVVESQAVQGMSRDDFICSSVEHQMEVVTTVSMDDRGATMSGIMVGLPHAGMFAHTWNAHRSSIRMLLSEREPLDTIAQAMLRYQTIQCTILDKGLLMDLFISDRILETARLLAKVSEQELCRDVAQARDWAHGTMCKSMWDIESLVQWDEMQMAEYGVAAAWCEFNVYAIMNAMNLNGCRAVVISDILTFLGVQQSSFMWFGYMNMFCGGAGHFRAKTEDGKADGPSVCKVNTTGHSSVVVDGFNNIQRLALYKDRGLQKETLDLFCMAKMDRTTRAGLESICAVEVVGNVVSQMPSRQMLGRAISSEEFFRNFSTAEARMCAVNTISRDGSAGTGSTEKFVDNPNRKDGKVSGRVQQLPGLPAFIVAAATNSPPPDTAAAEVMKSLLVVSNGCNPGAHKAYGGVLEINVMKRGRNELEEVSFGGKTAIPTNVEHCEHLANILTVVPMLCKQKLGLMNKTGLIDYEICHSYMLLVDWFKRHYKTLFRRTMGKMFLMSYDRVSGVQITRSVASCLNTTLTMHMCRSTPEKRISLEDACIQAMSDTQSSALTLAKCCNAMRDIICKTVDSNLLLVNGVIKAILKTPVVDVDFLCACLDPSKPLDNTCSDYVALRTFLADLVERRTPRDVPDRDPVEMMGNYLVVPGLPSSEMYFQMEGYLEHYLSIVTGSTYTYTEAVKECCSRSIEIDTLLDVETGAVKLSALCTRFAVPYQREWDCDPSSGRKRATKFLFPIFTGEKDNYMSKCFVNVVMHLFISAMVGKNHLHSDNRETWAANILGFMMNRYMPAQCIPSRMVIFDTFMEEDGNIVPQTLKCKDWGHSDYLVRPKFDPKAREKEELSTLKVNAWNYALEDVIHMGPYLQMRTILKAGAAITWADEIEFIPHVSCRVPEIVVGRVYSLYSRFLNGGVCYGTICLLPDGHGCAVVRTQTQRVACSITAWQDVVRSMKAVVGPLVHRRCAVVNLGELGLGVILERGESAFADDNLAEYDNFVDNDDYSKQVMNPEPRYFMDSEGYYLVLHAKAGDSPGTSDTDEEDGGVRQVASKVHYRDVHTGLLKMGCALVVDAAPLRKLFGSRRVREGVEFVSAWLRYPDEVKKDNSAELVYVCIRCLGCTAQAKMELVGVKPAHCSLPRRGRDVASYIYD